MAESGGAERIEGSRRLKTAEKEDRLSALPDSLIHHILSFLPSTKEAIQTGILSKRWLNQWTFVSNLVFDFSFMFSAYRRDGIPIYTSIISGILNQTLVLHQCSKIQKFQITTDMFHSHEYDPNSEDMIRFVVSKRVEELILEFSDRKLFRLPEFFFSQPFLVKLKLVKCSIVPPGMVNWRNMKDLSVTLCDCTDEVITSIVSASPLLQSLEVKYCFKSFNGLALASKSLKRLVLHNLQCSVDILCPNLVEFYGRHIAARCENFGRCDTDTVLEKFLSDSPLLETLELVNFQFTSAIATKLFKKVVFKKGN